MGRQNIRPKPSNRPSNSFPIPIFSNDDTDTSASIKVITFTGKNALDQSETLPSTHEHESGQAQALSTALTNPIVLYTYHAWNGWCCSVHQSLLAYFWAHSN
jgi:hypothetical protein